jgi:CHAD domain-containing protein
VQQVFRVLGRHRDRSIWAAWRERMRQALGADLVHAIPPVRAKRDDLAALLRSPGVNLAWLQWLRLCASTLAPRELEAHALEGSDAGSKQEGAVLFERHALDRLRRWHRRAQAAIAGFDAADEARRHRLRKRLKHMRYVLEILAPALPAKALKRHLRALRRAESLLGELNDLTVCVSLLQDAQRRHTFPPDTMAWLLDQRRRALRRCARALRDYASADHAVLRARCPTACPQPVPSLSKGLSTSPGLSTPSPGNAHRLVHGFIHRSRHRVHASCARPSQHPE